MTAVDARRESEAGPYGGFAGPPLYGPSERSARDAGGDIALRRTIDVPELALRMGRLHGARSVQLVLVDGLRFDLGLRVEQRLRSLLGQGAALTERLLLWSALPATSAVQLELIGRGAEALREFTGQVESEVPVARGRMASNCAT